MSTEPDHEGERSRQRGDEEPTVEIPATDTAAGRELSRLREERDQFEEQLKRALADTANIRRRQKQEMDDARRRVLEGITQELLPVLDGFNLALQAYDETQGKDTNGLVEGVRLVRTLLSGALERHGLQEIAAAGKPFDPGCHEAVAVEPSAQHAAGTVLRVLQPGYQLGDRVVRFSRVIVAGPPANEPTPS
jgi:molecular chaperone GrpE